MNVIHLKKGFTLRVDGIPPVNLRPLETPRHVGVIPEHIAHIKPRLLVAQGDSVAIGSPLFEDKRNPRIRFVSPGGGTVARIVFGPRRVIQQIVIALDADEAAESFDVPSLEKLGSMPREAVVALLLAGGMWPFLRTLPFMDLADPDITAPAIIVRVGDDEPFGPHPAVYLDQRQALFDLGIAVLKRLCDRVTVHLTGKADLPAWLFEQKDALHFTGPYATGNPAVQLYRTKTGPEQNRAWFIDGQDVVLLGEFIHSGRYPVHRIMSVAGSHAAEPGHVATRAGVPLRLLSGGPVGGESAARMIVGGLFTGFSGSTDGFMGFYQNALNLIDDGNREEFLGFIRPGMDKPSHSTAFLSALHRGPFPMDCGQHGELRACVNCGYCADVCPVDILPQFTMKCLVADEVEEALAHGLLDCAECGLCTFVCPSKLELREVLRTAKTQYYKEIV